MKLIVSGETKTFEDNITIQQLIEVEDVETPLYVTVSVNGEFPDRSEYESLVLKDGDEIEFLYFMGGGSDGFNQ